MLHAINTTEMRYYCVRDKDGLMPPDALCVKAFTDLPLQHFARHKLRQ